MLGRDSGGPGTYEEQLIRHTCAVDVDSEFHVWCSREGVDLLPNESANLHVHPWRPALRVPSVALVMPNLLKRLQIDLAHATFVPPPFMPVDYVFTVHDLSPLLRPEFYDPRVRRKLRFLIRRGIERAKVVLCISETTREHVIQEFKVSEDRLAVAYHGVNPRFSPGSTERARQSVRDAFGIDGRYMLFLGKIEARKNVARLLEAFAEFRHSGDEDIKLVLAGRRHWGVNDIDELIEKLKLGESVIETGFVADDMVPELYRAAEFMVFPSLWEGFGLPLLEAMACGTPVITSNVSCLPEIAGAAATQVDPLDTEAIADAMGKVSSDDVLRNSLRERGFSRAREFTWENTAAATLAVYRRALNNN